MKNLQNQWQRLFVASTQFIYRLATVVLVTTTLILFSESGFASNYYWVGGTGNWSDYGAHWATKSGGVIFHTTVPSPGDDVFFDSNSFPTTNDTVTGDLQNIYCKNMNWTGATNSPSINGNVLLVYGSLTLETAIHFNIYEIDFEAATMGNTITTNGQSFQYSVFNFTGVGGGWMFTDSLSGVAEINIWSGNINTNGQKITCSSFKVYNANNTVLTLGSSTIICDTWSMASTGSLNLSATSSTIFASETFGGGQSQNYNDVICGSFYPDHGIYHSVICQKDGNGNSNTIYDLQMIGDEYNYTGDSNVINYASFLNKNGINGNNNTIHKAIFTGEESILGTNTFDTVYFNNAGSIVYLGGTLNVNNALLADGTCGGLIYFQWVGNPGTQAIINKLSGNITVNYVLLKDIAATGSATFTANNSINAGNVTGWTINSPAPKNLFWVGGSGNWSDINHWALSSGGAGGNCIPNQLDDVFFDSNSFPTTNDTVTGDLQNIYCKNMNWTGATNSPSINGNVLLVYGSLTLETAIHFNIYEIDFEAATMGNTITTNGQSFQYSVFNFTGVGGGWMFTDSLSGVAEINIWSGNINTNGQKITCSSFKVYNANNTVLTLGSSTIICDTWSMASTGSLNLSATSSTIFASETFGGGQSQNYNDVICGSFYPDHGIYHSVICQKDGNGNSNTIYDLQMIGDEYNYTGDSNVINYASFLNKNGINGNNNTIHKAIFTGEESILGTNTFDTVYFNNAGSIVYLGGTLNVNNALLADGTCGGLIYFQWVGNPGTQAIINKLSGNITVNYVLLKDIAATGSATFTANNSINAGNVTGWTINSPAPKNLFWVGGSGNWSDINHWALSSGGAGGNCIPNQLDDVFFDSNSFPTTNDTVTGDLQNIYCKNMNWTGATNSPSINGNVLLVYGSLTLETAIHFNIYEIDFEAATMGNTITTNGQSFQYSVFNFTGVGGGWMFTDSLSGVAEINIWSGNINTNGQKITCSSFKVYNANNTVLTLGSSTIICDTWSMASTGSLNLSATSSTIFASETFGGGQSQNYNDVICGSFYPDHGIYHSVICQKDGNGNSNTIYDLQMIGDEYNYTGDSNVINYASFLNKNGINGNNNTIHKAIFTGEESILGTNTFDTVYFNNAGSIVYLGGTLNVNNALWTNPQAGFPTTFNSAFPGTQATISAPANDTICLDYLYLQDINATGGGVFYAGANSVDLGNNTGWLWSSCTPDTSNVWPGDANYDLIADNNDVLYIGLAYGYSGPVRGGASTNWVAQPGIDWLQQFANGMNIKHADCDGNGTINAADTLAVSLNYGQIHPFKLTNPLSPNNFGPDLYFDLPTSPLVPGTTVSIPIMFGTTALNADNVYGIAFTVNYDPSLIQAGTMSIDFSTSWLGNNANTIYLTKDFSANGMIDMGFVKIDHLNTSGQGTLATLTFTVANGAGGILNLSFSKIFIIDKNEIPISVNAIPGAVYTGLNENPSLENLIQVYPNPSSTELSVKDPNNIIQQIKLTDRIGKEILIQQNINSVIKLNVSGIANGIYFLRVETSKGILNKRIEVMH